MKLFYSATSPYVRKVSILISELGITDSIEVIGSVPMDNPGDLQSTNPLGKVPALVLGDGTALYDSPVICEYIDTENGNIFIPATGSGRWDCLRRQALGDGIIDASFTRTMERLKPQEEHSSLWLERWENAIKRGVGEAAKDLSGVTGRFDLGDVATLCALGYLDLRHSDLDWRKGNDELAGWFETVSKRQSVSSTTPPG